ncbi:uncharacterized protein LOC135116333 isoform X2 [Scylla paramamosain]|uniref:uncharacterized protein LOC135116333 isoform X2 n=1 Tax=Scylla paramamosain TaxID=85552 RepID=UPI003083C1FB
MRRRGENRINELAAARVSLRCHRLSKGRASQKHWRQGVNKRSTHLLAFPEGLTGAGGEAANFQGEDDDQEEKWSCERNVRRVESPGVLVPYASCKEYGFRLCGAYSMLTERRCEAAWLFPRRKVARSPRHRSNGCQGPARPATGRGVPRACWAWGVRRQAQVKGLAVFFAPSRRSLNRSVPSAPTWRRPPTWPPSKTQCPPASVRANSSGFGR